LCSNSLTGNDLSRLRIGEAPSCGSFAPACDGAIRSFRARNPHDDIRQQTFNRFFKEQNAVLGMEPAKEMIRMYTLCVK
jgi:hypothetical protein